MVTQNKDQANNSLVIKTKTFVFSKVVIIYLSLVALIVSLNFIYHILRILTADLIVAIGGLILLGIYLSITFINFIFLVRKKKVKDYKIVLIINVVFSLISGIAVRLPSFLFANNLGADISLVYLKTEIGSNFFIHYDTFNFIVQFQYTNVREPVLGFQINLIMWGISGFLFFCYRKLKAYNIIQ